MEGRVDGSDAAGIFVVDLCVDGCIDLWMHVSYEEGMKKIRAASTQTLTQTNTLV